MTKKNLYSKQSVYITNEMTAAPKISIPIDKTKCKIFWVLKPLK